MNCAHNNRHPQHHVKQKFVIVTVSVTVGPVDVNTRILSVLAILRPVDV
jgi:hypothetical protein